MKMVAKADCLLAAFWPKHDLLTRGVSPYLEASWIEVFYTMRHLSGPFCFRLRPVSLHFRDSPAVVEGLATAKSSWCPAGSSRCRDSQSAAVPELSQHGDPRCPQPLRSSQKKPPIPRPRSGNLLPARGLHLEEQLAALKAKR